MSDSIQNIMGKFTNFDPNSYGDPAISSLTYAEFENPTEEIPQDARLVLVLIEPRLLEPLSGTEDLTNRLKRFKADLRAEGFFSRFILANVYNGPLDQDGRTLLALRSFLREVKIMYTHFTGVVLIGAFPEATLVRRVIWAPDFKGTSIGTYVTSGEKYLAIEPELIATRSEIVLADLNGNWESVYHESPLSVESIRALPDSATASTDWPVDGGVFSSVMFTRQEKTFHDFFWIKDDEYEVLSSSPGQLKIYLHHQMRHLELSAADLKMPNPVARPDLIISRINAINVAENPDPNVHGDDGTLPVDESGSPQTFTSVNSYDTGPGIFRHDPVLERQLLCDYFDRNHQFRTGAFSDLPFRVASIAHRDFNAAWAADQLGKASPDLQAPIVQEDASVLDYVKWFKQPAVLRYIAAHANSMVTEFIGSYNVADLEQEVNGKPFRWYRDGNTYQPSLQGQGTSADWFLHRTLWQNHVLKNTGANLIIHSGCEVMGAYGEIYPSQPQYYQEWYAKFQNAESMLFYTNGLAILARAKVFDDSPLEYPDSFERGTRAHFGSGWMSYYDHVANDTNLAKFKYFIRSKLAYFWSLIGDWTLRLRYRAGLGILGFDPEFKALGVHADEAWIDGWNFYSRDNRVIGSGDFDGDGVNEFMVTSAWGIGILKKDGEGWCQVMVVPNGTRFGGWLLNTADNRFGPVADFDGDGRAEILVTSPWGVGILDLNGNMLEPVMMAPNGTRFGDWLLNTADNQFHLVADFNGDGRAEIAVTSPWGIGILALSGTGNTLESLMMAPNGTRFGDWLLNTADNRFGPAADLNGDGRTEIVVTSPWGIGILALSSTGNTLEPLMMAPNGTHLGDWILEPNDQIVAAGSFTGSNQRVELLVQKGN